MRQQFSEFLDDPIIPVLYGTSAMGPVLSVYKYDADLPPARIPRDDHFVNDVAPIERWKYHVLEDAREQRIRALVHEIKDMCTQVQGVRQLSSSWLHVQTSALLYTH
jgi:uncharacterized protein (DUF2461 family)